MPMTSNLKGFQGEKEVESVLQQISRRYTFKYIADAVVPTAGNSVTQIDFMIFSKRVFMCIEVKAWNGEIFIPKNKYDKWKVTYDSRPITPHNPIEQNEFHTRTVNNLSPLGMKYVNYIVFPNNPKIHNRLYTTGTLSDLASYICLKPERFSEETVEREYKKFRDLTDKYFPKYLEREIERGFAAESNPTSLFSEDYS